MSVDELPVALLLLLALVLLFTETEEERARCKLPMAPAPELPVTPSVADDDVDKLVVPRLDDDSVAGLLPVGVVGVPPMDMAGEGNGDVAALEPDDESRRSRA